MSTVTRTSTLHQPKPGTPPDAIRTDIEIGLTVAIVTVRGDTPLVIAVDDAPAAEGLPSGPFDPLQHRTMELGLREWVDAQTGLDLGYVEQLYTFGDRGRHAVPGDQGAHVVSVGYLALTRAETPPKSQTAIRTAFQDWYAFFPWEDWRGGRPTCLDTIILPALTRWSEQADPAPRRHALPRDQRLDLAFGQSENAETPWDEERVLERYELLYSAGLVVEAARDGRPAALARTDMPELGRPMRFDHRRILATAMGRIRAKLKYRPVVFEVMPDAFTLTELQTTVEAISGKHIHKQNFRRLVAASAMVEPTGEMTDQTGGRPAKRFRFRRDVQLERPAPGFRFGTRQ